MGHSLRNSLILLILFLILSGYFYFTISKINREIFIIETSLQKNQNELSNFGGLRPDTLRVHYMLEQINYMDAWLLQNSKVFLHEDNSKISWAYFQNIIKKFDPSFQYNFSVISKGQNQFEYNLTGTTEIHLFFNFINYIEKLAALYTIEALTINPIFRETDNGPVNNINYTLTIKPWIEKSVGIDILNSNLRKIAYSPLKKDPFRPGIHSPVREPKQENFIKHENLRLISFTSKEAFFIDNNNSIIKLSPKQQVAYGYFSHIDYKNKQAIFKINRTGLYQTIIKDLEKGN